jgi:hypothetical protein
VPVSLQTRRDQGDLHAALGHVTDACPEDDVGARIGSRPDLIGGETDLAQAQVGRTRDMQ